MLTEVEIQSVTQWSVAIKCVYFSTRRQPIMYHSVLTAVLLMFTVLLVSANPREYVERDEQESRMRRGWLDCKQPLARCAGFPPCCESHVCYFEGGYPSTNGVCVPCIDRTQICQRDSQCCEPLVCQKAKGYDANGRCDVKKPIGAECHDNDQCESDFCKIHWYNDLVMGHGGTCAAAGSGTR